MTRTTRTLADGIYFGEGPRWHDGHGFGGGVIDDRQALQHTAFGGAIEDEVG